VATRKPEKGTLSELLKEKPRRGRPPHAVSRQNVYVALTERQKGLMSALGKRLPVGLSRADVPDLAILVIAASRVCAGPPPAAPARSRRG
jgi:hypothetical protein